MFESKSMEFAEEMLSTRPQAHAAVQGSEKYPDIQGRVLFYQVEGGSIVFADITGLPDDRQKCAANIFGFHIHEGSTCTGTREDPFADTGMHFNPDGCEHPNHAGDLPPLFGNHGYAWMVFYTNRFLPEEVVGRTIVIHDKPDDFKTQPSGDSGEKIACGEIK